MGSPGEREVNAATLAPRYEIMGLQAVAACCAGYIATPLANASNKSSLPKLTVSEVLTLTRKDPFLGARWTCFRQFLSSVRGTVGVFMLNNAAAQHPQGKVDWLDWSKAVVAGGTAETCIAGVFVEIPEVRVQSGLTRFSLSAVNAFPFLLTRNILTTMSPAYIIMNKINEGADVGISGKAKEQNRALEWGGAVLRTLGMATTVAMFTAPLQGVAARIIQDQTLGSAVANTKLDFLWVNRRLTALRVGTRALFTGCTGSAITLAYLVGEEYFK